MMDSIGDFPVLPADISIEAAARALQHYGLGDGLPLVPPTSQRLRSMLAAVTDSQWSAGLMPPLFGDLRVAAVAYQCVLAGCEPAHLPIVMAAAQAVLAPEFNLLGVLTTTGTPAVAVVVHGPIAAALGVRGDGNCLGPGAGANACIGRALSLVMRNIGGAREGIGDMATMGQPAKYTLCFGESPDATIPSLAVRRGLSATQDAVTVMAISGTAEILPVEGGSNAAQILGPVALSMGAAIAQSGARQRPPQGQVMLLPPELLRALAKFGYGVCEIQEYLYQLGYVPALPGESVVAAKVARAAADIDIIEVGGAGVKMTYAPLWSGGTEIQTVPVAALT